MKLNEVDPLTVQYIENSLKNVTISIAPQDNVSAIKMSREGDLEGWCWQSATFLSVFFNDNDIVCRGMLSLDRIDDYFHSWIELHYNGKDYVFDPALNYLCDWVAYYQRFKTILKQQIEVVKIRTALINLIKDNNQKPFYLPGTDNISDPFFRTNSQVTAELDNNKIKKLNTRFYYNG